MAVSQLNPEAFKFYHLFFNFQWNLGIIPYKYDMTYKKIVFQTDTFFKLRNFICNCVFIYIVFQNMILTGINVYTGLEFEPIEHSIVLQTSWILIFILITSILLIFEIKAVELMETVSVWIKLDYFIQGKVENNEIINRCLLF